MVFLKQFFTFINFRKTVRDLGYWIGGTLSFAGVSYASWQQHLISDARELQTLLDIIKAKDSLFYDERAKREAITYKYIDSKEKDKKYNDSLALEYYKRLTEKE